MGSQVIGRAFTRALRQELQCKIILEYTRFFYWGNLDAKTATESGKSTTKTVQADRVTGMSLQVRTIASSFDPHPVLHSLLGS